VKNERQNRVSNSFVVLHGIGVWLGDVGGDRRSDYGVVRPCEQARKGSCSTARGNGVCVSRQRRAMAELIGIGEGSFQIERWCCKQEDIGEY